MASPDRRSWSVVTGEIYADGPAPRRRPVPEGRDPRGARGRGSCSARPGERPVRRGGPRRLCRRRHGRLRPVRPPLVLLDAARRPVRLRLRGEGAPRRPRGGARPRPGGARGVPPARRALLGHDAALRGEGGAGRGAGPIVRRNADHRGVVADPIHLERRESEHDAAAEEAGRLFRRWVARQTAGNDRIGVPLSGGLDSRICLAGVPADRARDVTSFTWGDRGCLDRIFARQTARRCGVRHHDSRLPVRCARRGRRSGRLDHRRARGGHRLPHPPVRRRPRRERGGDPQRVRRGCPPRWELPLAQRPEPAARRARARDVREAERRALAR